jgi:hypothetical protein
MTDVGTFPTINNVVYSMGITISMLTTGSSDVDIKPGMVLAIDATGVTDTVRAALAEAGERPFGVSITNADVSTAERVSVMLSGIAFVTNYDDTATVDAGAWMITNDNAVGGTVEEALITATAVATASLSDLTIGYLLDDMAASGNARLFIHPNTITRANSS